MDEFGGIKQFFFLLPLLQITVTGEIQHVVFKDGDEVTLPCDNVRNVEERCRDVEWIFTDLRSTGGVKLISRGRNSESDRVTVTKRCSLVIQKVTDEDAGWYICREGGHHDTEFFLFIVSMTEEEQDDGVTLCCSVSQLERRCRHRVKWLYDGNSTEESRCSVRKTFPASKRLKLLRCEVTNNDNGKWKQFLFRDRSSDEDETSTTMITTESDKRIDSKGPPRAGGWWIILAGVLAALALILIVAVITWKRTKGNNKVKNKGQSLNTAMVESAPEADQDQADHEDVSYSSISYTKKTHKARVEVKNADNEGDSVTYSSVKVSSSSAGASDDPGSLYASVNKTNRRRQ